jgi:hypothetical protein
MGGLENAPNEGHSGPRQQRLFIDIFVVVGS